MKKPLVLLGAGGHGKVLLALAKAVGFEVIRVCVPEVKSTEDSWRGLPLCSEKYDLLSMRPDQVDLINGVGDQTIRKKIFEKYKSLGYHFPALVHPFSWIDKAVTLGEGVQVMAGVVIQPDTTIGNNVILNTRASIDHDCVVGDHTHIAPGAILCGSVQVGSGVFIASGSVIADGIRIEDYAVAAAGASVVRDIPSGQVVMPAPVRKSGKTLSQ